MSNYIIKVKNTSGIEGTIIADAGFSYSDKLNEVNEGQLKISGTGEVKRSLFEIGSEVYIYRNGTLEFRGIIQSLSYLDAGGISADLQGYEVWLGKENGDYPGSPWESTASSSIASAIISESSKFSAGTIQSGETLDFRAEATASLWNALSSLIKRTAQDIGVNYSNLTIDILDHRGNSTSVMTLNDGVQIMDLTVRQTYPVANDVRVYGQGEGNTRIKSNTGHGQDSTSQSTYGVIRKIYDDPSVTTEDEANILADKLVAKWKTPVKIYEFDIINPNKNLISGDVITLNSSTKGLLNEEVRVVAIDRGFRNSQEFMTLQVSNKEYSSMERGIDKIVAELEKRANDLHTYDQYQDEYANANVSTCIAGNSFVCDDGTFNFAGKLWDNGPVTCLCDVFGVYYGNQYLSFNPGMTVCAPMIQTGNHCGMSSTKNIFSNGLVMCNTKIEALANPTANQDAATKWYVDNSSGGGNLWTDAANPYIMPCNGCGIAVCNHICAAADGLCLGIPMSPGVWKEVHAYCGLFLTCISTGDVCATDDVVAGDYICGAGLSISGGAFIGNCLGVSQIGIGGSSACAFYVSGNSYGSGSVCSGTCFSSSVGCFSCTYSCRKLKIPVGVNCY